MPFIRYTRDKRGYETTYVMHGYRSSQGPGGTRVLYLFRSPSHLTTGRRPLDEESRVALEHTHPDLSFDWEAIGRDLATPREPSGQPRREARSSRSRPKPRPSQPQPPAVVDDQSVLGRTLGAPEAARLRARYTGLLQRIARRARSPEERDQLRDRAQRLNPDEWGDEVAVRGGVSTAEAEWDALDAALPQRRRGRRGGRREPPGRGAQEAPSSAMMGGTGDVHAVSEEAQPNRPDRDTGAPGDGGDSGGGRSGPDGISGGD